MLLLIFVVCGFVIIGTQVARRLLKPIPPAKRDVADELDPNAPDGPVKKAKKPPVDTPLPPPPAPRTPVGQIRFAEDATFKKSDFWLEQPFELSADGAREGKQLLKLFAGLDDKTMRGLSVTLSGWELVLESSDGKDGPKHELARQKLAAFPPGEYDLGMLWRRGELSVWIGALELIKWKPAEGDHTADLLKLDSAALVFDASVNLGARRALPFDTIRFDDNFMRSKANDAWKPSSGKWELTSMAFAERSANPFSMRVSFGDKKPFEDEIYGGDKRTRPDDYGLGVQISVAEGTPHIVRITGGSPAAHAGLAEDDIFVEVNGQPVDMTNPGSLYRQLFHLGGDLNLKMYRPGEKAFREYSIARDSYKWGVSIESEPILPINAPSTRDGDDFAFVTAGENGWSDYEAEVAVKPLGGGGFGLAVAAVSDQEYVLFRWRGPYSRGETGNTKTNVLQLVRVKNNVETVLAEKPAHYRPYEFYRMGVNWNGDSIQCLIDKNEMLSAKIPDLKRGKIGLYALKGDPVFFDDVHVAGDRTITAAWHLAERSLNSIFALEDDMEVWANPALEFERDIKTGWSIHNQRFPGEQAVSMSKPRFNELEIALYCADDPDQPSCPRLTIKNGVAELTGDGLQKQRLDVGAGPFERIGVEASVNGIQALIDGKKLSAEWPGGKPNFGRPGVRAGGDRVAIKGLKNLGDPNTVRVTSTGTMEYTFDNAPSDWKVISGRWGLLNKWICDPRWSWFGGRTKTCAAIWNKHIFSGDVSVDAHVALLMVRDDPPFERSGDHNMVICGDGINLDSGYTLIFGGDMNSWTRLYRKGALVAETGKEEFRVHSDRIRHPDKPDLHQRWFHLKLEKIGNTVSFYRDGVQAFKFIDPEPLPEGRIGFWTMDNSFLLSRVRIAHGGARPAPFEDGRCAHFDDGKAVNIVDGETPTTVTSEALPTEVSAALGLPANAFKPVDGIAPVAANDSAKNAGTPSAYHIVNGIGGGPFALQFRGHLIDTERDGVVRFAYRIDPGANVDLYLVNVRENEFNPRHAGCYRWRLSGPKADNSGALADEFAPLVADIPGAVADGKWHVAQLDLQPTWRQFWRNRGYSQPARLNLRPMFGNLDNTGYLLAGMNGNHAGASYSVTEIQTFSDTSADNQAPTVARVIWPFDAEGDGHSIVVQFNELGGSGIIPESVRVTLNGVQLPADLPLVDGRSPFDAATQTLRLDLNQLRNADDTAFVFKDGWKYALKVDPNFSDRAGNANKDGFTTSWTYQAKDALNAKKAVEAPLISMSRTDPTEVIPGTRPLSVNSIAVIPPTTRAQSSQEAPPWALAGQKNSVEVVAMGELPSMGFQLRGARYELKNWPYLDLDYRVPRDTPFNLHLLTEMNEYHALLLVDVEDGRDNTSAEISSRFGPPADFVPDNTWRHSTIPLMNLFSNANPNTTSPKIAGFSFHDHGWRGGRRGLHYWIHRIQPVPAGHLDDISAAWTAADVTGIVDTETSVDGSPTGDPSGKHELAAAANLAASASKNGTKLKDGWNYVHVRVKNGAGIWSETAHRKFFLDTTPPRIVKTEPVDGGILTSQTLRIYLEEEHGIDMSAASVRLNGEVATRWMEFDPVTRVIKINLQNAGMTLAPGVKLKVDINGLVDGFGNAQAQPYSFTVTNSTGGKKTGPEIESLRYQSATEIGVYHRQYDMEVSFGLSFEEHFGHVHAMRDCKMEWLNDPALAEEGNRAVRFTCLQDDGDPQIMMHKNPWFIDRLPLLHFDYKADPGFKTDIQIEVFGVWYAIRFLGAGHAPTDGKTIGSIPGVVADGVWRHASVDLRELLDLAKVRMPDRIINKIIFSANGDDGCVRGAALSIDNFDMVPSGGGFWRQARAMLKWSAKKTPGEVSGYSYVIDQEPLTSPPEVINDQGGMVGVAPRSGIWYFHVRACDQLGNWGPPKSIRLDFGRPSSRRTTREFDDDN